MHVTAHKRVTKSSGMLSEILKFLSIDILLQFPMKLLKQICLSENQETADIKLKLHAVMFTPQIE